MMNPKHSLFFLFSLFVFSAFAQRNVVLIIADDLGMDYLGFYENHLDTVNAPNIRRLLDRGVRFTNAWAAPVCSPTRAGILTGRYSFRTGVGQAIGGDSPELDTSEITIPKLLNRFSPNGIAKANIGKWHLQKLSPLNYTFPNKMGYDHYEGNFSGGLGSYTDWSKVKNGTVSKVTTYATTETVNNAISWVKAQNKPFFLWLAFNAPHTPYHLPPSNLHAYKNLSGTQSDIATNPKSYFKAMTEALDTEIGRFIDTLKALNQWENTDIIFIGDNGNSPTVAQDAGGAKGTLDEGGIHVPFLISGPSVTRPGRTSDALVNVQDLFATILELFGYTQWQAQIPASKPVDSKSLLPLLKDQSGEVRSWAFSEMFSIPVQPEDGKTIRNKEYKLLALDDGTQRLFHLPSDPTESVNLLTGKMTVAAQSNYNALCAEMGNLLGSARYCQLATASATLLSEDRRPVMYPNPVTDYLNILNAPDGAHARIFNSLGRLVFESAGPPPFNISALPAGFYFLDLTGRNEEVIKFVKNG